MWQVTRSMKYRYQRDRNRKHKRRAGLSVEAMKKEITVEYVGAKRLTNCLSSIHANAVAASNSFIKIV